MKIKIFALVAVCAISLTGCSSGGGSSKKTINVYNWGDYIEESILEQFEQETGIHVNYDTYATNEDMYAKIKSGGSSYDIAIPSDYMIEKMRMEGLLEKIDLNNVPNYANIHERFDHLAFDPTNEYSVPYMWGTLGILYNKTMVSDTVDSWNILWDEKYANQIFMYNSQRDSIGVSLKRLGYSLNSKDPNELKLAQAELIKQKPLVKAYVGDTVKDSMIGNEAALAVVYSGDAIYCMGENPDLAYIVPKEGSNVWFDSIVIPKGAQHKAEAEQFIDFLCRGDIAAKNTEYIGYSTVNKVALEQLPAELKDDPTFWPSDEIYNKAEVFIDLGNFIAEYDKAWTEVLASR